MQRATKALAGSQHGQSSASHKNKCPLPGLGIFLAVLSALAFSATVVTAKMVKAVHPTFVLLARSTLQVSFCLAGMIYNGTPFKQARGIKFRVFLCMLGLSGGLTNFLVYAGLSYIQPADVIGILYCSPALVSFLACMWLKEPCTVTHGFSVTLAVLGAIFVSKPSFLFGSGSEQNEDHWIGCVLSLGASFAYSGIFIFSRLLPKIPSETSNFLIGLVSLVLSLPFNLSDRIALPGCGVDSVIFLASALLGTIAYLLLTAAPRFEEATLVSIISSTEILFTIPLQVVFLEETPSWNCYVGSSMITVSVVVLGVLRCGSQKSLNVEDNCTEKLTRSRCLNTAKLLQMWTNKYKTETRV